MAEYLHRIETEEIETEYLPADGATSGLQVVVGTAPVNMAADPAAVVNTPVLVRSFTEAKKLLGYSTDFANYTLCQAMDATLRDRGIQPIVFINVLDPATHKTALAETSCTVVNKQAKVAVAGVLTDGLVVKNGDAAMTPGTDYALSFDDEGNLIVTVLLNTVPASIKVSGFKLDPSAVDADAIIGGYVAATGAETGIEVIRQVYPKYGVIPQTLVVPKWSATPAVAAVMQTKIHDINGVFNAIAVIDVDTVTYKTYTSLENAKSAMGITDRDCVLVWPKVKSGNKVYDGSVKWAAMAQATDSERGDIPYKSPSNEDARISAAVLADGTEILLDYTQAELVNSFGICTFLNDQGWKAWGNETAAYPESTDAEDRFIACRRMMTWYRNRFIRTYKNKVDEPTNPRLVEAFVDSENQFLNGLASSGAIPPGSRVTYNEEENTLDDILNGDIVFDCDIAFWTPAKHIKERIRFNYQLLADAFAGGEE